MIEAPTAANPSEDAPAQDQRRRRRGVLALLLGLTVVSLGAGMFSLAYFTDFSDTTGTFQTGTVDINSSPTVAFTVTDMVPGDKDTQALTISNDGTAQLRYSLTSTATGALGDALTLEVREVGSGCGAFDGNVVLAATALDGAAFGNPATGDDSGDRVLDAPGSEVLCFRVALPTSATSSVQGASSSATFRFDAEQTANNP